MLMFMYTCGLVDAQQLEQLEELVVLINHHDMLLHCVADSAPAADLDLDGLAQDLARQNLWLA
jgi:hypothetical protein